MSPDRRTDLRSGGTPEDWQEIRQVIYSYCTAVDRLDMDLLRRCFHPGAEADYGPYQQGSIEEFIDFVPTDECVGSMRRTMHTILNILIEVDGDVAYTESYGIAYHDGPEDHPWANGFFVAYVRYVDKFERRQDGAWRISRRKVILEWGRNETTGQETSYLPEAQGIKDRTDPRYARD